MTSSVHTTYIDHRDTNQFAFAIRTMSILFLHRSPVNSLLRFVCQCPSWMFNSPFFLLSFSMHYHRNYIRGDTPVAPFLIRDSCCWCEGRAEIRSQTSFRLQQYYMAGLHRELLARHTIQHPRQASEAAIMALATQLNMQKKQKSFAKDVHSGSGCGIADLWLPVIVGLRLTASLKRS